MVNRALHLPDAPPPPSVGEAWLRQLLVLLGLSGFAISQPLLSLLGDNPLLFTFYDVEGLGLVLYVIALTFMPPLALWLLGLGATAVNRTLGWWVHLATVGVLVGLAAIQIVKALDIESPALVGLFAVVIAGGFTLAYSRVKIVVTWVQFTAILPFLALALFFFSSPSGELLRSPEAADVADGANADSLPSVVFIVLDELPTMSMLNENDEVDATRFPNIAAFGEDATWYRRYSTVSGSTEYAIPSMLTGSAPKLDPPLWSFYPDNLFSLLAPTHDLSVFETATELCGLDTCSEGPPGVPVSTDSQYRNLLDLTNDLYQERVSLQPTKGARLDTFQEQTQQELAASALPAQDVADPDVAGFSVEAVLNRPTRLNQFMDSLEPRPDHPALFFLHLMLPHQPWHYYENGVVYDTLFGFQSTYPFTAQNDQGEWISALTEQRHLLQAQYTDQLVGQIVEELKAKDLYDDSLVILAADHGISFDTDSSMRMLHPDSLVGIPGIAFPPLFIKPPGQTEGAIDDSSLMTIDVLPTIADIMGIELPFEVEGAPAGSDAIDERDDDRWYYDLEGAMGGSKTLRGIPHFKGEDYFPSADDRWVGAIEPGDDPMAGLYEWIGLPDVIGKPLDELQPEPGGSATFEGVDRLTDPPADKPLLGLIVGSVTSGPDDGFVVLAIDGKIVSASPVFEYLDKPGSFAMLIPPGSLDEDGNEVRLAAITDDGAVELELVE